MILVVYPGSLIRIMTFNPSPIPDPMIKKAPDPGSGSPTLVFLFLISYALRIRRASPRFSISGYPDQVSLYSKIWLGTPFKVFFSYFFNAVVTYQVPYCSLIVFSWVLYLIPAEVYLSKKKRQSTHLKVFLLQLRGCCVR
jgi:hypothetical protein